MYTPNSLLTSAGSSCMYLMFFCSFCHENETAKTTSLCVFLSTLSPDWLALYEYNNLIG